MLEDEVRRRVVVGTVGQAVGHEVDALVALLNLEVLPFAAVVFSNSRVLNHGKGHLLRNWLRLLLPSWGELAQSTAVPVGRLRLDLALVAIAHHAAAT